MFSSLLDFVDNLSEGLYLEYVKVEDNQLTFDCLKCNKKHKKYFIKDFIKKLAKTYKFCDGDINKFSLLKRKVIYPFENLDSCKRFNETLLPDKENFYSNLNIENITDIAYRHAKKAWKSFEIKNLSYYYDLYVKNDTLMLADVFESFHNKCIEIHELDPAHFLSASGLAWQTCFKKAEVELELLIDIYMLLMVEKEKEEEYVMQYINM